MDVVDLYLRKSNQDGGRSAARQETDLTAEATEAGLSIGRTFVDPDLSASRFAKKARPDYAALLDHIRSGRCTTVGIVEASRGSRSLTEWSAFLDLCRAQKVKIWVQTHDRIYDLSRRRDWRALADEGLDAADESEKISERTLSGKRKSAADGRPAGRAIYGHLRRYDDRGKLIAVEAHPEQAPVVREMVSRIIAGDSLRSITLDLNSRGLTAPEGGEWRPSTVRQVMLRPAHIGKRIHHGQVHGDAMWSAIVDERQWHQACAILNQPGRATARGTPLTHWLSGAVLCGACRKDTLRRGGRGKYLCKHCMRVSVHAEPLEKLIETAIMRRLSRPDALSAFTARPDDAAVDAAEAELLVLRQRLEGLYVEAAEGRLSASGLAAVEKRLLPEIERAEAEVKRLMLPPDIAEFANVDVVSEWGNFDAVKRRRIVLALAELVLAPATRRGPGFDPTRLDGSRWRGGVSWGE